jgi:hypothetical protein
VPSLVSINHGDIASFLPWTVEPNTGVIVPTLSMLVVDGLQVELEKQMEVTMPLNTSFLLFQKDCAGCTFLLEISGSSLLDINPTPEAALGTKGKSR